MGRVTLTQALDYYGATAVNIRYAVSAITSDRKEIVVSCWEQFLHDLGDGCYAYRDSFARWKVNERGRRLLSSHLNLAKLMQLPVRLIIASPTRPDLVEAGGDTSKIPKTFSVRPELVGEVVSVNNAGFEVRFSQKG